MIIDKLTVEVGADINDFDTKIDKSGKKLKDFDDKAKKNSENIKKSTKTLNGMSQELVKMKKNLGDLEIGSKEFKKLQKEIEKTEQKIIKAGKSSKSFFSKFGKAGLIGAAIAGTTAFIGKIVEIDTNLVKLQASTGATKEEMKGLKKSFLDLSSSGYTNFADNVKILGDIKKEFGLVGDEATKLSRQYLAISQVFDKDVNEVFRASNSLVKSFGITAVESNDLIAGSLKKVGDNYDDLLDTINEYSLKMSEAGFSAEGFIDKLIKGTDSGLRNFDEFADMMRESAIRIVDGSDKTKIALAQIGIDYGEMVKSMSEGGTNIEGIMQKVAAEILKIEDPILRNQVATDLLGTKYEDNGIKMVEALANAENKLGDVGGQAELTAEDLEKSITFQTNQLSGEISSLAGKAIPFLLTAFQWIQVGVHSLMTVFKVFGNTIMGVTLYVGAVMQDLASTIGTAFHNGGVHLANFSNYVKAIFKNIVTNIKIAGDNMGVVFSGGFVNGIKIGFNKGLELVSGFLNKSASLLNGLFSKLGLDVKVGTFKFAKLDVGPVKGSYKEMLDLDNGYLKQKTRIYKKNAGKLLDITSKLYFDDARKNIADHKKFQDKKLGILGSTEDKARIILKKTEEEKNKALYENIKNLIKNEKDKAKLLKKLGGKGCGGSKGGKKAIEDEAKALKKAVDEQIKDLEDLKKNGVSAYGDINGKIDKQKTKVEKLKDEYEKISEKIKKVGEKGKADIEKITVAIIKLDNKLKAIKSEGNTSIAERDLEILAEKKQLLEDLAGLENSGSLGHKSKQVQDINKDLEGNLSENRRNKLLDKKAYLLEQINEKIKNSNNLNGEAYAIKQKLLALDEEAKLNSENINPESLKKVEDENSKSKTQKILDGIAEKIAKVEEERLALEKQKEEKILAVEKEIAGLEEIKLAKQAEKDFEIGNLETYLEAKNNLEEAYYEATGLRFKGEEDKVGTLTKKYLALARAKKKAGYSGTVLGTAASLSGGSKEKDKKEKNIGDKKTVNFYGDVTNNNQGDFEKFAEKVNSKLN